MYAKLKMVNDRPFQKLDGSRTSWFFDIDKPALQPLPERRYEFKEQKVATVHLDYHIEFSRALYSVPFFLIGEKVNVLATPLTVEIYHRGQRVAVHPRASKRERYVTQKDHMPDNHRFQASRSPESMISWATDVGPDAGRWAEELFKTLTLPEQGYRAVLGVIGLAKKYPRQRVNDACRRALSYRALRYHSVKSILQNGLDSISDEQEQQQPPLPDHEHVRGADYYKKGGETQWLSNKH